MKTLIAVLLVVSVASIARATPSGIGIMTSYADNAILNAAESGQKKITLVFGDAPVEDVEAVADDLRARGYRLDEQAALLNPAVIKVRNLNVARTAKLETK